MILWGAYCGVHTVFTPEHVHWWQERNWRVIVHPESRLEVVQAADGSGSTKYLWDQMLTAPAGSRLVIGTEGHFVRNAREVGRSRGVEIMHLADIPDANFGTAGCGCAPDANRVLAGAAVDEITGRRERLDATERLQLTREARSALERMIAVVEHGA